jgi:thiol-disulfide isomerase/thioredoxin
MQGASASSEPPPKPARESSSWTVIIAIFTAVFALAVLPRLFAHDLVGKPAPEMTLPLMMGAPVVPGMAGAKGVDLASLRGHVVVLDFWAPWCGPCRQEMPHLDALYKKHAGEGVMVMGVLVDDDRTGARALVQKLGLTYPQLDDEQHLAANRYDVHSLPTLVVLDKAGTVKTYRAGFTSEDELEAYIAAASK